MKKIILLITIILSISYSNSCIGYTYESDIIENVQVPKVIIQSPSTLPDSGSVTLRANEDMDSRATPYFRWCTNIGRLYSKDKNFRNVQWILPSGWEEQVYRAKIYLVAGDSLGYEAYAKKEFKGKVHLDPNTPSTQLNVQYIKSEDKFRVLWQSKNTENLEVLYSWDNVTFKRFAMLSVKNQATGSHLERISGSKTHRRIYMKPVSIKGSTQVKGKVNVWEYEPQTNTKEKPSRALLKSLKDRTIHDYVYVGWYEVKDSNGNKNADKYELSYADNSHFDNEKKIEVSTGCSCKVTNLKDDTTYYFRVRAINSAGEGDWSSVESIRVDIQDRPTINNMTQTPTNGTTGVSKTPTFKWSASDKDGDELEYYVSIGESKDNLHYKSGWISRKQQFNFSDEFSRPLKPNTTYYWQVTFREAHHDRAYYGGEYPKSEIWSFTTESTGPDLAITNIKMIGELKIDEWVPFEVTIKNNGSEVADDEDIIPYFVKNGKENEFAAYKRGNMQKQLKPGEEEKVIVKVQFSNKIEKRTFTRFNADGTEYQETVEYDNILTDGANIVRFKINYSLFDIDANSKNDEKDLSINYSMADNLPVIKYSDLIQNNLSAQKGDYRYMLGWKVSYRVEAEDQVKIDKYELEYRTSKNDNWHHIKTYTNNSSKISERLEWIIPNNKELITQTMQLRVKVYNPSGKYSSVVSPEFKVFDNDVNIDELYVDKNSYILGEPIMVTYSASHKTPIESFKIYIKTDNTSEKLYEYKIGENSIFNDADNMSFNVPNEDRLLGNDTYIEIFIKDTNGAYKRVKSEKFTIIQNTEVPKPFTPYKDVFTWQYDNFPSNSSHHETENYVKKVIIDENGLAHLLIEQIAWWWGKDSRGHTTYSNRNWRYYYLTYNPKTGAKSTPKKIFENQIIDDGNLPDEMYKDFIMNGNTPILITTNDKTYCATKYQLNGNSVSKSILVTGSEFDSYSLANYKGKTYLTYRYLVDIVEDRRVKSKEIYPSVGDDFNIVDNYYGSSFRINNDMLSFFYEGITFQLDSNFKVIVSTKHEITLDNKLKGEIKIYDSNIKEMYADSEDNLFLLKMDNTIEKLFYLENSTISDRTSGYYQKIEASIYKDVVIVVYPATPKEHQYKVVIYNRKTKMTESILIGNKIYGFGEVYTNIDINGKKDIVLANPDGRHDYAAQIVSANLNDGFGAPAVSIDTKVNTIKVDDEVTINWSMAKESDKLDKFQIYKVVNGSSKLLKTVYDTSVRSYTYKQTNSNEKMVSLRVVAITTNGDSSADQISLRVIKPIQITYFSVDKNAIDLHEALNFSWETIGGYNNLYKGYKKCSTDTSWSKIFETKAKTKTYIVNDFVGVCKFKIVSGKSEKILANSVEIDGKIYKFKADSFLPKGEYQIDNGIIEFKWDTTFEDDVEFSLFIKKSGASEFKKVATTMSRKYQLNEAIDKAFEWKVSFNDGAKEIVSPVINIMPKSISKPTIVNSSLKLENHQPKVVLTLSSLSTGTSYEIYRSEYGNKFRKIGTSNNTSYEDKEVNFGESYDYYIVGVKDSLHSLPSETKQVDIEVNESYDVIMETPNNQLLTGKSIVINYKPSKTVSFEKYEIRIGTAPNDMFFYTATYDRSVTIEGLEYRTTYYIEVYPVNPSGNWISTAPAKLTFSTGFDQRDITTKAEISIDEVATDHVSLSWNSVDNADKYIVLRSENGEDYESLGTVIDTSFVDSINLLEGAKYKYVIKAFNANSFILSDESNEVNIPFADTDNDGIPDDKERDLGLNPNNPDSDGDGISDLDEVGDINNPTDTDGDGIIDALDTDSDNDGISDKDEVKYGLNPKDNSDANKDSDGDGVSNIDEIKAGTNPKDKNDKPLDEKVWLEPIDDIFMQQREVTKYVNLKIVNTTNEKINISATSNNKNLVVVSDTNPLEITHIGNKKGQATIKVSISAGGKSDNKEFTVYVGEKPKKFVPISVDDIIIMVPF